MSQSANDSAEEQARAAQTFHLTSKTQEKAYEPPDFTMVRKFRENMRDSRCRLCHFQDAVTAYVLSS